jgi:hypothetical protein
MLKNEIGITFILLPQCYSINSSGHNIDLKLLLLRELRNTHISLVGAFKFYLMISVSPI